MFAAGGGGGYCDQVENVIIAIGQAWFFVWYDLTGRKRKNYKLKVSMADT